MFTRVRVKNYKSLVDLDVNLSCKKDSINPLIIIYGENGVGKSNFTDVFNTLKDSFYTMSWKIRADRIKEKLSEEMQEDQFDFTTREFLSNFFMSTNTIINRSKTIDSTEDMLLEFSFIINNKKGKYSLSYDNSNITNEKLEYQLNRKQITLFEIKKDNIKINESTITDSNYLKEFTALLQKFNGKHSFMSLIINEIKEKADNYVLSRVNPGLVDIVREFSERVCVKTEEESIDFENTSLPSIKSGIISTKKTKAIDRLENIIDGFFTQTYSDIKKVYYKKINTKDDTVKYDLYFKKLVYGKLIDVKYDLESTGTKKLLEMLPFIITCYSGNTVVIDEFDTGIHDLLVNSILTNFSEYIKGQLIITTHNTTLLESGIDPSSMYVFHVDSEANKELLPITAFGPRKHPFNNYRNRYLKGLYGGVPFSSDIDFDDLLDSDH